MYHNFFIHSSVDGHLGCFHDLAIVNSAAMNVRAHVFFQIIVFSGCMPRSGIEECDPLFSWSLSLIYFFHRIYHLIIHYNNVVVYYVYGVSSMPCQLQDVCFVHWCRPRTYNGALHVIGFSINNDRIDTKKSNKDWYSLLDILTAAT